MQLKQSQQVIIILIIIYLVVSNLLAFRYFAPETPITLWPGNVSGLLMSLHKATTHRRGAKSESLCVLVRTYSDHRLGLLSLLYSLSHSMEQDFNTNDRIQRLNVIVADTQYGNESDSSAGQVKALLQEAAASVKRNAPLSMSLFSFERPPQFQGDQWNYGYDITNMMLDRVTTTSSLECDRIMFTNGDNSYGGSFIKSLNDWIKEPARDTDMIGVYFVSHYTRKYENGTERRNRFKKTQFRETMVDLGSVVVKKSAITSLCRSAVRFQLGEFTADWRFFEKIISCNGTTSVIPEVLFLHN